MEGTVTLAHGSGGKLTHELIERIFRKHFDNDYLKEGHDSARLSMPAGRLAFTTDSFVISPIFFKGGDIGKLAVCGTVNDLAASGARPLYLSCGFIIEEGFSFSDLERITASMASTARQCGVSIVTGDTKVVQKGAADKIFINTSGIGVIADGVDISGAGAKPGDKVIVTGNIGEHGCSILLEREKFNFASGLKSDCAPLNRLVECVLEADKDVHVLRDPTRGGLAATLNEIAAQSGVGILLHESELPVSREVRGVCELLGMDPLYMANEGKMLIIVSSASAPCVLDALLKDGLAPEAHVIGEVTDRPAGQVLLKTSAGGTRMIVMPSGDPLPRIC